jgi:hypothetical protein
LHFLRIALGSAEEVAASLYVAEASDHLIPYAAPRGDGILVEGGSDQIEGVSWCVTR